MELMRACLQPNATKSSLTLYATAAVQSGTRQFEPDEKLLD